MSNPLATSTLVYVGTYTESLPFVEAQAVGIYRYQLDLSSGALSQGHTAAETPNPSYVAIAPNQRFLYAVDERDDGQVRAFAIDPATGDLTYLNQQSSHGETPAHISVDRSGQWVLVANYESGSSSILPILADGSIGPATDIIQHEGHGVDPNRQSGPHAHCIITDPSNRFVLIADLGIDKVMLYALDVVHGKLVPNDPPWATIQTGAGPRSLAIHPNGRHVYLINELDATITTCAFDTTNGSLQPLQYVLTLPPDFSGETSCAAIRVAPSGNFVYGSNRGHDSIAIFAVDPQTGTLTPVGHQSTGGRTPRDFNIDPTGTFLLAANQDSNTIVTFRIDPATGQLSPTGQTTEVMTPVCITFLSA